jgi:hypothetical protein
MAEQEQQEEEREAARRAEERSAQLDQMRSEQQGQQQHSLADEPAPDLSDIQSQRDSGSGMELSRQLGGAPRETEQWKIDGMKLTADLQAGGMKPYNNEAPRSLADEPAPDLSDIDQKIADAEQQVQQRDTELERQQEQER